MNRIVRLVILFTLGAPSVAHAHGPGKATPATVKDVPRYLEVFRGEDLTAMDDAIASLAAVGTPALPQLLTALVDPTPRVRSQVAAVLTRMGPAAKGAVPQLTKNLADADPDVRWNSANALGAIGKPAAVAMEALQKMAASDPIPPLQRAAQQAMTQIKAAKSLSVQP